MSYIEKITNKYRGKKEFLNSNIINSLEQLTILIAATSGEIRTNEDEQSYIDLSRAIQSEYRNIVSNL